MKNAKNDFDVENALSDVCDENCDDDKCQLWKKTIEDNDIWFVVDCIEKVLRYLFNCEFDDENDHVDVQKTQWEKLTFEKMTKKKSNE